MKFLYSTGSLTSMMPALWEGKIRGKLLTGQVAISWPGSEVDRYERDGPGWRGEAKDNDHSEIDSNREYQRLGWLDGDAGKKEGDEVQMELVEVSDDTDNLHSEGWGWKILEGHKGRGEGVFEFEGVTGSATLMGEKK